MSHAYRSSYDVLVGKRIERFRQGREALEPLLGRLHVVSEQRSARVLAGLVGLVGAAFVALTAFGSGGAPTAVLVGSVPAMAITYAVARVVLRGASYAGRGRLGVPDVPSLTGKLDEDMARLDAADPVRVVEGYSIGSGRTHATLSVALPLAAISLLAPLNLHLVFSLLFMNASASLPSLASSYAEWIRISLVIVGHAHLALMILAILFARRLMARPYDELGAMNIHAEWSKALGITVLVSAVPGIVFMLVPPLLSAITGLAFVPLMFVVARAITMSERSALELARLAVAEPGSSCPPV
jgi:hypothetical protein